MPRSIKNLLLITCCAFQSLLNAQYSLQDLDSLCLLSETRQWRPLVLKLNRIWKATPDTAFVKSNFSEGLFWIKWMHLQKASRSDLRRGYMYFAHRIKRTENLSLASQYYLKAHQLVDDPFCLDSVAWYIENELATFYNRQDDLDESLYYHRLVKNSLEYFGNIEQLSRANTNISKLLYTQGRWNEALHHAQEGLNIATREKYSQGIVSNAIQIADLLIEIDSIKDVLKYIQLAKKVYTFAPENKLNENQYLIHKALADFNTKKRNYRIAESNYQTASDFLLKANQLPRDYVKLCNTSARMYLEMGDSAKCRSKLLQGLSALWGETGQLELDTPQSQNLKDNTYAELFSTTSDYFFQRYQTENKIQFLKYSLQYLEWAIFGYQQIQSNITTDASKLSIIYHNRRLVEKAIQRLYSLKLVRYIPVFSNALNTSNPLFSWKRLGGDTLDIHSRVRAFLLAAKGRLLNEKATTHQALDEFSKQEQHKLLQLQERALWLTTNKGKPGLEPAFVENEILKIKRKRLQILSKVKPIKLTSNFPDQYLEYHLDPHSVYLFAKINGKTYFEKLGTRQELDDLLHQWQKCIVNTTDTCYIKIQKDLYAFLIPQQLKNIPSHLCIIPDGELQQLSYDALMNSSGQYLFQYSTLWYAHSYAEFQHDETNHKKSSKLIFIHPQYPEAPTEILLAQRGHAYALPYTKEELKGVREAMGSQVSLDTQCQLIPLLNKIRNFNIVHYAGHAKAIGGEAYWELGGDHQRLGLEELSHFYHPLKMVVLSACETGLGSWEYGEGLRSLGKSFREAGAQSVIMSLWAVNDQSTAIIMNQFYQGLKNGKSKDEALKTAKLKYLQNESLEKRHPYYWAGFVGYGDNYEITILNNN